MKIAIFGFLLHLIASHCIHKEALEGHVISVYTPPETQRRFLQEAISGPIRIHTKNVDLVKPPQKLFDLEENIMNVAKSFYESFLEFLKELPGFELLQIKPLFEGRISHFTIFLKNISHAFSYYYAPDSQEVSQGGSFEFTYFLEGYVEARLYQIVSDFSVSDSDSTRISNTSIVFRDRLPFRNYSISAELFGCNIIVNSLLTRKFFPDRFYYILEIAKKGSTSLIFSFAEYIDVTQDESTSNYRVVFAIRNEASGLQILFEAELVDQGEGSYFSSYTIDGVDITMQLEQINKKFQEGLLDSGNTFSAQIESFYCQKSSQNVTQNELCLEFSGNKCISCSTDSYRQNGVCLSLYLLKPNGKCVKIPEKCYNYDLKFYQCYNCQAGYHLLNNDCLPDIDHCINYNSRNKCTKCYYGYRALNGACTPIDKQCVWYTELDGWCLLCNTGYIISEVDGSCLPQ